MVLAALACAVPSTILVSMVASVGWTGRQPWDTSVCAPLDMKAIIAKTSSM